MPSTDCGKLCHTETRAKALAIASECYRRAYYCALCDAWHTTSRPHNAGHESQIFRNPANRFRI